MFGRGISGAGQNPPSGITRSRSALASAMPALPLVLPACAPRRLGPLGPGFIVTLPSPAGDGMSYRACGPRRRGTSSQAGPAAPQVLPGRPYPRTAPLLGARRALEYAARVPGSARDGAEPA